LVANERIYDTVMQCESADVSAEITELVLTRSLSSSDINAVIQYFVTCEM